LKLYERLGFVAEGRRREDTWFSIGWHDGGELGMLDREWLAKMEKWGEGNLVEG
jgi:hypothetical protein